MTNPTGCRLIPRTKGSRILVVAGDPHAILASIHRALAHRGRLVIIEFKPDGLVGTVTRMGTDRARLIGAVTAAGFEVVTSDEWPGWDHYVAVFDKQ